MLRELGKADEGIAMFSIPVTLAICGAAFAMQRHAWSWWGAGITTAVVLHILLLLALVSLMGGEESPIQFLGWVLYTPIESVVNDVARLPVFDPFTALAWAVVGGSLIRLAAHPLRPSFFTALVSTIGVSLWFLLSMTMMANAG